MPLLGLIDADGCFHFSRQYSKNKKDGWSRRCIIASTYDQNWGSIQKILSDLEIKSFITRRISKTGKSSTLTISGMRGITALYNFIYPQGFQFGLKRKYDKCQECIIPRPKSKLNPITN